jgi:hypothetical protein
MNALKASIQKDILPPRARSGFLASLWIAAGLALVSVPVHAAQTTSPERLAPKSVKQNVTAVAAKDPETTSSIQVDSEEGVNCDRSRKRLFVEGEGWIVRRVTTCY